MRAALVLACFLPLACSAEPRSPRGVVLVLLDTLRADRLGCYGYERRPNSPRLDRLATQGVLFENAISHAPWTIASVASILSGFPDTRAFDGELQRSLVESLSAAGVRTAAFTEGGYFSASFGFDRGFGEFHEEHYQFGGTIERTVDSALAWLGTARSDARPFFLLVHSYEAHMPYLRATFAASMAPARFGELFTQEAHEAVAAGELVLTPAELERLGALYDGGVATCDRELGRLIDGLEALGLRDEIVLVVTSDHGEELAEGRFPRHAGNHGHSLHEELVHVPLLITAPGLAARRVANQVRSMDVLPTLLDLLGVVGPDDIEGRSLVALFAGRAEDGERVARGGSVEEGPAREFVRLAGHKLVRRLEPPEPGSEFAHVPELQLFDLARDPDERHDLAAERPELVRTLFALMDASAVQTIDPDALELSPELAERLRALGY
jgi:arylsulfatase A-like enzyme